MRTISVVMVGACGRWADQNHFPALIAMKQQGIPVRVSAVVDTCDPYSSVFGDAGREVLRRDQPQWIKTALDSDETVVAALDELLTNGSCDALVISAPPTAHEFYLRWALSREVNALCDKPILVVPDSSHDPDHAAAIWRTYSELRRLAQRVRAKSPWYLMALPLRRRSLEPFDRIAQGLGELAASTGQGITFLNALVHGGLHRFPSEFRNGGAHGYRDGVGGLTHSSYHYIDLIAWYLGQAPGEGRRLRVRLNYVRRIRDYLRARGHSTLQAVLGVDDPDTPLPAEIEHCELDCGFGIQLLDGDNTPIGQLTYVTNHTSYSPRQIGLRPDMIDAANDCRGGRMSHLYLDIHQGALQNWQMVKNDRAGLENSIHLTRRLHPALGREHETTTYSDAYEATAVHPRDLVSAFLTHSAGRAIPAEAFPYLARLEDQHLTMHLFSTFYELIADDAAGRHRARYIELSE